METYNTHSMLFQRLTPEQQEQAIAFMRFLLDYKQPVDNERTKTSPKRNLGILKGKIRMSPDFDAPMEDFKEYM